jgi:hypothetical protein
MPTEPLPPPVSICEVMPMTCPWELISGLQHVGDREAVRRLDLALQGRDDAAGYGAVEAEGVADRDYRITDLRLGGVAEGQRVQRIRRRVDLEQGEVGGRVGADLLGGVGLRAVAELHVDLVGARDNVVVGEDVAVGVDHEPRAGGGSTALRLSEETERRRLLRSQLGLDECHPVRVGPVDLVDHVGVLNLAGVRYRHRERRRDRGGGAVRIRLDPPGADGDQADESDDQAADQRRAERGAEEPLELLCHEPIFGLGRQRSLNRFQSRAKTCRR